MSSVHKRNCLVEETVSVVAGFSRERSLAHCFYVASLFLIIRHEKADSASLCRCTAVVFRERRGEISSLFLKLFTSPTSRRTFLPLDPPDISGLTPICGRRNNHLRRGGLVGSFYTLGAENRPATWQPAAARLAAGEHVKVSVERGAVFPGIQLSITETEQKLFLGHRSQREKLIARARISSCDTLR
ncbi:hypothetical protein ILYODFUR_027584 [Ilyodon furcidens]|uniref:Uncharacterized protein n=1 Tax=Ilyodon furcidens TaxID=33524 RepID=A0ABV0TQ43_9TELE